jgi:hypothetical protein
MDTYIIKYIFKSNQNIVYVYFNTLYAHLDAESVELFISVDQLFKITIWKKNP